MPVLDFSFSFLNLHFNNVVIYLDHSISVLKALPWCKLIALIQDDFLPRTATPLEDVFKSIFWLVFLCPCHCRGHLCLSSCHTSPHTRKLSGVGYYYYLLNQVLVLCTAYPACCFWFVWEIPSFQKVESLEIQEDFMPLDECIIL